MSGKGATRNTNSEEAKLAAATLLKQAGDLQEAIQRFRSDRGGFNNLTFSTAPDTGLFNIKDRFATLLVGPPKGYVTRKPDNFVNGTNSNGSYGSWSLNRSVKLDEVENNWVVVTTGLSKTTCVRINNLIYGAQFPITLDPQDSNVAATVWQTNLLVTIDFTGTNSAPGIPENATEGCVKTTSMATNPETGGSEATYAYFKTVNEGNAD